MKTIVAILLVSSMFIAYRTYIQEPVHLNFSNKVQIKEYEEAISTDTVDLSSIRIQYEPIKKEIDSLTNKINRDSRILEIKFNAIKEKQRILDSLKAKDEFAKYIDQDYLEEVAIK